MNFIYNIKYIIIGLLLLFVGCKKAETDSQGNIEINSKITIAAAANLRDVLEDLKQIYIKENPNKEVNITFGSSGLLVQQIMNGAPYDLFLSADSSFPKKIEEVGKASREAEVYAYGKVALWSSKQDVSKGLNLLLDEKIKKIAIANPQLAPYGRNTIEALEKSGFYSKIKHKIVWAENINQAGQFASTGSADVGFIALSNAKNKEMMTKGSFYELSEVECSPIPQSGIVIKGKNEHEAQAFFNFIRSEEVVEIWKSYGYLTKNSK